MTSTIFKTLKSYSTKPIEVDRLIVSAFLEINKVEVRNNTIIKSLIIKQKDTSFRNLKFFISTIKSEIKNFDLEALIELFEFVISPSDRIINGAIYTPFEIRNYIAQKSISNKAILNSKFKVCDPACGCAGFLLTASQLIHKHTGKSYSDIYRENIYGLDIQNYSIKRSKILLSLAAILEGEDENFEFNLYQGNALSFEWSNILKGFKGFSVVVGNPPYVCSRNIDEESKALLDNWSVCSTGHPDLYIPFFQIGINLLETGGKMGYITMNTFFKSVNGRALRAYFQEKTSNLEIIDFGAYQVFDSKSTYTCICLFENTPSDHLDYVKLDNLNDLLENNFNSKKIHYKTLNSERGWNLEEQQLIDKIESTGIALGKKFKSRNGIATLKNKIYIFDPFRHDEQFYYIIHDGKEYPIERNCCVDIVNPNKLINLDSVETLRKKIIFPYAINNNQVKTIDENQFANNFPNAYSYLDSNRKELAKRDKGKGAEYDIWYQYGRNQSLEPFPYKLLFPHISPHIPNYVTNDEPDLLFVNGLAIVSENLRDLEFLRKVMSSRLFWFYIVNTSKPYGSGYYSLSRNYIKHFGIYEFNEEQIEYLICTENQNEIDLFLERLYNIDLSHFKTPDQNLETEAA
ncbi:class I SAM-dependent DNA methyltransferase [Christiangramia sp. LLG6405-1]|uniref:class I SAM-dependent DNA methyltransferase n=1 Tax=Christiangramia sp. LLG6405-1 TaxID=3160832 RepID=UPI0038702B8D